LEIFPRQPDVPRGKMLSQFYIYILGRLGILQYGIRKFTNAYLLHAGGSKPPFL